MGKRKRIGAQEFTALHPLEAFRRTNERMKQHPLNEGEIQHSAHYMISLMEEEIARLKNTTDFLLKSIVQFTKKTPNEKVVKYTVRMIKEEMKGLGSKGSGYELVPKKKVPTMAKRKVGSVG